MKTLQNFLVVIFILSNSLLYSFDTTSAKYYPLSIGNIYVYQYRVNANMYYRKNVIAKDSVFNHHRYFLITTLPDNIRRWRRIDSLTTNLMQFDSSNSCSYYGYEKFIDSLSAKKGDYEKEACNSSRSQCTDTSYIQLFNINSQRKRFDLALGIPQVSGHITYTKYIGYYESSSGYYPYGSSSEILMGCVLNGVVFGDTAFPPLGISVLSYDKPNDYNISQNFPNPFNPYTDINFSVTESAYTTLNVFDISGKLICTIVSSFLQSGKYKVVFNGTNYASGIYFYSLTSGNFSKTKKMILMK